MPMSDMRWLRSAIVLNVLENRGVVVVVVVVDVVAVVVVGKRVMRVC